MTSGIGPAIENVLGGLDWNDIKLFLAVAREGTLSGAAPKVGMTQPTAGRRLREFERRVGGALFQRSSKGFQLTEDGENVLHFAERMEGAAIGLDRQRGLGALCGSFRISTSDWFARVVLTQGVCSFVERNPGVTIEMLTDTRHYDLDRREADVVFRFARFEGPDLVQRRFTNVLYGAYASHAYIDRRGEPSRSGGGEGHVLVSMNMAMEQLADVGWLRELLPKASYAVRANSREFQAEACACGAGIAVLPRVLAAKHDLVEIDLGEAAPDRDVWLGYHPDLRRMRRLRTFVDYICDTTPSIIS